MHTPAEQLGGLEMTELQRRLDLVEHRGTEDATLARSEGPWSPPLRLDGTGATRATIAHLAS